LLSQRDIPYPENNPVLGHYYYVYYRSVVSFLVIVAAPAVALIALNSLVYRRLQVSIGQKFVPTWEEHLLLSLAFPFVILSQAGKGEK